MGKSVSNKSTSSRSKTARKTTIRKSTKEPKLLLTLPTPKDGKSPYLDLANKCNVEVIFKPFFKIEGVTANNFRKQNLGLDEVTAMIITSKSAVDHLFRLVEDLKFKISENLKYFCKSETVALYLQKFINYRKRKVFFPKNGKMDQFFELLEKHKENENFMYCSSNNTHDRLSKFLKTGDFQFQKAVLYNIVPSLEVIELKKDRWDCIVFFSPNAVKIFLDHQDFFTHKNLKIAAFGPATKEELASNDIEVDFCAPCDRFSSMYDLLEYSYK